MTEKKEISQDLKKKLKAKAKLMDPIVRIGKNGITDSMIEHIKSMLKKRQLVKIKLLKSFVDCYSDENVAQQLAAKTESVLVDEIGFNVVLYKPKQIEMKRREERKKEEQPRD